MAQVDSENSITRPAVSTRRRFLSQAASVAAGSAVLATGATIPAPAEALPQVPDPILAAIDDSALSKLEEYIFEQYERATAFDDEIYKAHSAWVDEFERLRRETDLTERECLALAGETPQCKEQTRLCGLQAPFLEKMDALTKEMFAIPAKTSEGRRAKVMVLLGTIMPNDWHEVDKDMDYPERMARSLLIEFIGGEPGEMLRGQFA